MKRWIDLWNAYWFPTHYDARVFPFHALSRSPLNFLVFSEARRNMNLPANNTEFMDPQPLIRPIPALVPREVFFTPADLRDLL